VALLPRRVEPQALLGILERGVVPLEADVRGRTVREEPRRLARLRGPDRPLDRRGVVRRRLLEAALLERRVAHLLLVARQKVLDEVHLSGGVEATTCQACGAEGRMT